MKKSIVKSENNTSKNENSRDFFDSHIVVASIPSLEASEHNEAEASKDFNIEAVKDLIKASFNNKIEASKLKASSKEVLISSIISEAVDFCEEAKDEEGKTISYKIVDFIKASEHEAEASKCFNRIAYNSFMVKYQSKLKSAFEEVRSNEKQVFEKSYFYRLFKTTEKCFSLILCYMINHGAFNCINGLRDASSVESLNDFKNNIIKRYFDIFKENKISFEGLNKSFEILEALTSVDALGASEALQSIKDKYTEEAKAKKEASDKKAILKDFGYSSEEAEDFKEADSVTFVLAILGSLTDAQREQIYISLRDSLFGKAEDEVEAS